MTLRWVVKIRLIETDQLALIQHQGEEGGPTESRSSDKKHNYISNPIFSKKLI